MMALYALGERSPNVHPNAFVHPDATVIGSVEIGDEATVWPGAVLRGDYGTIRIGARTSVQDGSVIHATRELDTIIGADCVVGHLAHMEGCTIDDSCLVGSGSVVLHRVHIGSGSLVAAGAVVRNGTQVPERSLALGIPAKVKENAVDEDSFAETVALYVANGHRYRAELRRLD